ncbi:hypothetical protein [Pontibacter liquoris]|uniref:hypothetical protein n=1 Tax=Pontibacter liquoris TaxID=2905677 RepID=UPI001FA81518|nr:hypothetical protein [Pontibacter liquoris]
MWKFFLVAALVAAYRLWQADQMVMAGIAAFSALMVFWSAGVIDNYARASGNYWETGSVVESVVVAVNFLFTMSSLGLLIYSFF